MFEQYVYIASLLIALATLGVIDYRWRLVLFQNWRAATRVLVVSAGFFLVWDYCGIVQDIFYSGHSRFMTNLYIVRNLPLEEPFFLLLLNYLPLLLYEWLERRRHV